MHEYNLLVVGFGLVRQKITVVWGISVATMRFNFTIDVFLSLLLIRLNSQQTYIFIIFLFHTLKASLYREPSKWGRRKRSAQYLSSSSSKLAANNTKRLPILLRWSLLVHGRVDSVYHQLFSSDPKTTKHFALAHRGGVRIVWYSYPVERTSYGYVRLVYFLWSN